MLRESVVGLVGALLVGGCFGSHGGDAGPTGERMDAAPVVADAGRDVDGYAGFDAGAETRRAVAEFMDAYRRGRCELFARCEGVG